MVSGQTISNYILLNLLVCPGEFPNPSYFPLDVLVPDEPIPVTVNRNMKQIVFDTNLTYKYMCVRYMCFTVYTAECWYMIMFSSFCVNHQLAMDNNNDIDNIQYDFTVMFGFSKQY